MKDFELPKIDIYEAPESTIKPLGFPDEGEKNTVCMFCDDTRTDNGFCIGCGVSPS